jgi:hypothetical protein
VKCRPAVGAATAAPLLCKHGLVALAIERFVRALDIRRQGNVPEAIKSFVKADSSM